MVEIVGLLCFAWLSLNAKKERNWARGVIVKNLSLCSYFFCQSEGG